MTVQPRYLTDKEVATMLGVHRITVWNWHREGRLPAPVKLAPNTTRWRADDIDQWCEARDREAAS